jgi:hypothetical protein
MWSYSFSGLLSEANRTHVALTKNKLQDFGASRDPRKLISSSPARPMDALSLGMNVTQFRLHGADHDQGLEHVNDTPGAVPLLVRWIQQSLHSTGKQRGV